MHSNRHISWFFFYIISLSVNISLKIVERRIMVMIGQYEISYVAHFIFLHLCNKCSCAITSFRFISFLLLEARGRSNMRILLNRQLLPRPHKCIYPMYIWIWTITLL